MVLIVDDDESIRDALQLMLQLNGYSSAVVGNGVEALDWLRRNATPCLILLDLMMPVMDGWRFIDRMRSDGFDAVPIVVITAFRDDRALSQRCPVLRKPIEFGDLVQIVAQHCQPAA